MDGNKIIYNKIHNSISVVEETPSQIQKKRKQEGFFKNYT